MAQNEPQRKETPPGPSPNSPSLLFEYQCRSGKFIRLANRIESKLFCPNWNALVQTQELSCPALIGATVEPGCMSADYWQSVAQSTASSYAACSSSVA